MCLTLLSDGGGRRERFIKAQRECKLQETHNEWLSTSLASCLARDNVAAATKSALIAICERCATHIHVHIHAHIRPLILRIVCWRCCLKLDVACSMRLALGFGCVYYLLFVIQRNDDLHNKPRSCRSRKRFGCFVLCNCSRTRISFNVLQLEYIFGAKNKAYLRRTLVAGHLE